MRTLHTGRIVIILALGLLLGLLTPLATSARIDLESDPGSPVRLSNLALASRLFDAVFNDGDVAAAERLVADDAVILTPYGAFTGPEGLQDYLDILRRAYPDAAFAVTAIDAEGDTIVVHWTMTAARFSLGPNEPELEVRVRRTGETTITTANGQVASLDLTQQPTASTPKPDFAVSDGPSE